jgi:hypothetical protein
MVTAAIALLPHISDFFISAYVLGALAAVWFAARKLRATLSFNEGAQLGFLSGFYGVISATAIYDFVWQFLGLGFWRIENAERMIRFWIAAVRDAFTPSFWIITTIQILVSVIFAAAIGAPAGILAVKLFQRAASAGKAG